MQSRTNQTNWAEFVPILRLKWRSNRCKLVHLQLKRHTCWAPVTLKIRRWVFFSLSEWASKFQTSKLLLTLNCHNDACIVILPCTWTCQLEIWPVSSTDGICHSVTNYRSFCFNYRSIISYFSTLSTSPCCDGGAWASLYDSKSNAGWDISPRKFQPCWILVSRERLDKGRSLILQVGESGMGHGATTTHAWAKGRRLGIHAWCLDVKASEKHPGRNLHRSPSKHLKLDAGMFQLVLCSR